MDCLSNARLVAWNAPLNSSMGYDHQIPEKLSQDTLNLESMKLMQMYRGQTNSANCRPTRLGEVSEDLNTYSKPLPNKRQIAHPVALDTANGFSSYFEQASMIKSGTATQTSDRVPVTFSLDTWSPTSMPVGGDGEHQLFNSTKHGNLSHSIHDHQVQRRRDQNRAAQRAFRARKEKYTRDLEKDYGQLVERYNELVQLLQDVGVDHTGTAVNPLRGEEEQAREDGASEKEKR